MKISKIELTREDILSVPANERVFLIYAGHALNELNILSRMVVFSMPIRRGEAERQIMVGQSQVFLRLLAGKLHETSSLFEKTYYKSKVSMMVGNGLSDEVKATLKNLRRYFNKGNKAAITAIRNLHAFHYDPEQVDVGLMKLDPRMTLDIYFDEKSANTFYGFADSVINSAVMTSIDRENHSDAFKTLLSDIERITQSFQLVLEALIEQIVMKRLPHRFTKQALSHEQAQSTEWAKIVLPTFVENPAPWSVTLHNGKVLRWGGQRVEGPKFLTSLLEKKEAR
ncbi:hypothetical protein GTP58_13270 [Duganella sp. CY15W]|uniref:hypothetical protein n=1 Tax=Duganella sp. CY15W TaxID=2692172 RepID=UPI00136CA2C8|nr:hypothetical protein [Duganella sp. CY15W]MYM29294.1 hypothetical protein [Duganella sp. CY15W]